MSTFLSLLSPTPRAIVYRSVHIDEPLRPNAGNNASSRDLVSGSAESRYRQIGVRKGVGS